jgi:fumarate hydratase subunit alpha
MHDTDIIQGIIHLIRTAETTLPPDVTAALQTALHNETGIAHLQLTTILDNITKAQHTQRPICQDTGIQTFFIDAGTHSPHLHHIHTLLQQALTQATTTIPLRPNAVNPLTRTNGTTPTPITYYNLVPGDTLTIHALPKGSGSENMTRLHMLNPSDGIPGIKQTVLQTIIAAAGRPCPPTIVGIGIGGDAPTSLKLGKHALLRPLGTRNTDPTIARLETDLITSLNQTGIGPMGLGGNTTVLDVHIETTPCHPAGLPLGIILQCWAHRHAQLTIHPDGTWEVQ